MYQIYQTEIYTTCSLQLYGLTVVLFVCYAHSTNMYSKGKDQPNSNPARGQLNRENDFFPVPVRA